MLCLLGQITARKLRIMSKNLENDNSRIYEIGYVVASSVPEEKVGKEVESIKGILSKAKAEIIGEGEPSFRDLAYTVVKKVGAKNEKFTQGYFGWVKFAMDSDAIEAVKKDIEAMDSLIRVLVITTVRDNTFLGKLGAGVETLNSKASVTPDAISIDASLDTDVKDADIAIAKEGDVKVADEA